MFRTILFTAAVCFAAIKPASAQNTYPWPSSGNIGIGTSSPTYMLDVYAPNVPMIGRFLGNRSTYTSLAVENADAGDGDTQIRFRQAGTTKWSMGNEGTSDNFVIKMGGGAFGSFSDFFKINQLGYIAIGETFVPNFHLSVDGRIICEELVVENSVNWPDFVFAPDYELMPLDELASFIEDNSHLPEIPSAEKVAADGIGVGEMQTKLLRKIEELTLHVIELNEKNEQLEKRLDQIEK